MFTVALIGPDGAGKSTVTGHLPEVLPLPMTSIYMGVNRDRAETMLPTTRLLLALKRAGTGELQHRHGSEPARREARGGLRSLASGARAGLRLGTWVSEEWFRQALAWYHSRLRGTVVVFDRHFFVDFHPLHTGEREADRRLTSRIHTFLLAHLYPKPDLMIFLDAPAEVLYARKQEASVEWLRRRREQYLQIGREVPNFTTVDATKPAEDVARDVAAAICAFHESRRTS